MPGYAYHYLGMIVDIESMEILFKKTVIFVNDGHHPQYLIDHTLRFLDKFGIEGFLQSDVKLLCQWAQGLIDLFNRIQATASLFQKTKVDPKW